jgi:taurine dioxygenase
MAMNGYETIGVEPIAGSLGARVTGVHLGSGASPEQLDEIRRALLDHLVLFLHDQGLDDDSQIAFARTFGEPHPHPVDESLGNPSVISLVQSEYQKPQRNGSKFHTDYSFHTHTPDVAVLRALVMPPKGGDTIWASMYEAYDALSPTVQSFLDGLSAFHDKSSTFTGVQTSRYGAGAVETVHEKFPGSIHPVVIRHPVTQRKALYVNPGFTRSIVDVTDRESEALLRFLFDHINQPRFHCRYHWSVGDIAIWDERATVHQGEGAFWPEKRLLHRVCVGNAPPVAAVEDRDADRAEAPAAVG